MRCMAYSKSGFPCISTELLLNAVANGSYCCGLPIIGPCPPSSVHFKQERPNLALRCRPLRVRYRRHGKNLFVHRTSCQLDSARERKLRPLQKATLDEEAI